MDKQILRDFGKASNWKEQAKDLKAGQKLEVNVPDEIKNKILDGYSTILNRFGNKKHLKCYKALFRYNDKNIYKLKVT